MGSPDLARYGDGHHRGVSGTRAGSVETLLRDLEPIEDEGPHGVGAVVHEDRDLDLHAPGERLEHEVNGILSPGRAADPHPNAAEVGRAEPGDEGGEGGGPG